MKTITGKEAVELIESAEAVIVHDGNAGLTYPSVEEDEDEGYTTIDCTFLDGDGMNYWYSFEIKENGTIKASGNSIYLKDVTTGNELAISLLETKEL